MKKKLLAIFLSLTLLVSSLAGEGIHTLLHAASNPVDDGSTLKIRLFVQDTLNWSGSWGSDSYVGNHTSGEVNWTDFSGLNSYFTASNTEGWNPERMRFCAEIGGEANWFNFKEGAFNGDRGPAANVNYTYSDIVLKSEGYNDVVIPGTTKSSYWARVKEEWGSSGDTDLVDLLNPVLQQLSITAQQFGEDYLPKLQSINLTLTCNSLDCAHAEMVYTDKLDGTHDGFCEYCQQVVNEPHQFVYGQCVKCGAVDSEYVAPEIEIGLYAGTLDGGAPTIGTVTIDDRPGRYTLTNTAPLSGTGPFNMLVVKATAENCSTPLKGIKIKTNEIKADNTVIYPAEGNTMEYITGDDGRFEIVYYAPGYGETWNNKVDFGEITSASTVSVTFTVDPDNYTLEVPAPDAEGWVNLSNEYAYYNPNEAGQQTLSVPLVGAEIGDKIEVDIEGTGTPDSNIRFYIANNGNQDHNFTGGNSNYTTIASDGTFSFKGTTAKLFMPNNGNPEVTRFIFKAPFDGTPCDISETVFTKFRYRVIKASPDAGEEGWEPVDEATFETMTDVFGFTEAEIDPDTHRISYNGGAYGWENLNIDGSVYDKIRVVFKEYVNDAGQVYANGNDGSNGNSDAFNAEKMTSTILLDRGRIYTTLYVQNWGGNCSFIIDKVEKHKIPESFVIPGGQAITVKKNVWDDGGYDYSGEITPVIEGRYWDWNPTVQEAIECFSGKNLSVSFDVYGLFDENYDEIDMSKANFTTIIAAGNSWDEINTYYDSVNHKVYADFGDMSERLIKISDTSTGIAIMIGVHVDANTSNTDMTLYIDNIEAFVTDSEVEEGWEILKDVNGDDFTYENLHEANIYENGQISYDPETGIITLFGGDYYWDINVDGSKYDRIRIYFKTYSNESGGPSVIGRNENYYTHYLSPTTFEGRLAEFALNRDIVYNRIQMSNYGSPDYPESGAKFAIDHIEVHKIPEGVVFPDGVAVQLPYNKWGNNYQCNLPLYLGKFYSDNLYTAKMAADRYESIVLSFDIVGLMDRNYNDISINNLYYNSVIQNDDTWQSYSADDQYGQRSVTIDFGDLSQRFNELDPSKTVSILATVGMDLQYSDTDMTLYLDNIRTEVVPKAGPEPDEEGWIDVEIDPMTYVGDHGIPMITVPLCGAKVGDRIEVDIEGMGTPDTGIRFYVANDFTFNNKFTGENDNIANISSDGKFAFGGTTGRLTVTEYGDETVTRFVFEPTEENGCTLTDTQFTKFRYRVLNELPVPDEYKDWRVLDVDSMTGDGNGFHVMFDDDYKPLINDTVSYYITGNVANDYADDMIRFYISTGGWQNDDLSTSVRTTVGGRKEFVFEGTVPVDNPNSREGEAATFHFKANNFGVTIGQVQFDRFYYKINCGPENHRYENYESDENGHWSICERCGLTSEIQKHEFKYTDNGDGTHKGVCTVCGYETENESHKGGTATCVKRAVCEVCGVEYGELAEHDLTDWADTGDGKNHERHCKRDGCDYKEIEAHKGGTATCTEQATCDVCGAKYGDKLDHDLTNWADAKDGKNHERHCKREGCDYKETEAHKGGTATCTEQATCEVCGAKYGEKLDHDLTDWADAKDGKNHERHCKREGCVYKETEAHKGGTATCTEQAACEVCGAKYGDKLDHDLTDWADAKDGKNHERHCKREGCDYKEIEAHKGGTATCTEQATCEVCGAKYGDKLDHDLTDWADAKDGKNHERHCKREGCDYKETEAHKGGTATCTDQATCEVCGAKYGDKLDHDLTDWADAKDGKNHERHCKREGCDYKETEAHKGGTATCTEQATCEVCGAKYGDLAKHTEVSIPGKPATCTESGLTDGTKCSVCGKILKAQETIPAKGHTKEVVKGKPATCTETGLTDGEKCSVCGEILKKQEELPALGHKYGEPVWTWSSDSKTATATFTCANDNTHVQVVNATVTSTTVLPTLTTPGATTYTAAAVFEGRTYTAQNVVVIPIPGPTGNSHLHTWVWDFDAVSHRQLCSGCGMYLNYGPHNFVNDVCIDCGYVADVIDVNTPIEDTDQNSEEETSGDDLTVDDTQAPVESNPETGLAVSALTLAMAAVATVFSKRR